MDKFGVWINVFCLAGQSVMHIIFVSRLTGKKKKLHYLAGYFLILCILEYFFTRFMLPEKLAIGAELLVLYGISRFWLKNPRPVSWAASVFAIYMVQLSFGIVNSVEAMIFPHIIGKPVLFLLVFLAVLVSFVLCACCCAAALNCLSLAEDSQVLYAGLLVLPGMFFFAAQMYILQTSYRNVSTVLTLEETGKHGALLFLQIMGLGALFCMLYIYRHLCRSFQAQETLRSLTQAVHAQKTYVAEAQMRYEKTRAFRHDIANHLTVLDGLLGKGRIDEGRAYLQKLKTVSASLSFPCQTGVPAVDILLGEKLGQAQANGIAASASLCLPKPCGIDVFDLCVIFANALDNAIEACQSVGGETTIEVRGEQQGDFYLLTIENTCSNAPPAPEGTGLSNIKAVAEKYHGAMLTEKTDRRFFLHVLLNRGC